GSQPDDADHLRPANATMIPTLPVRLRKEGNATQADSVMEPTSPVETAQRIGMALCRTAYWDPDGQLCNWMGRSSGEASEYGGSITPTSAALGPDLYGGSAGVALFLAQLHALAGDPEFRRTALGGITRSIRQLERRPPKEPISALSFFSGDL